MVVEGGIETRDGKMKGVCEADGEWRGREAGSGFRSRRATQVNSQ